MNSNECRNPKSLHLFITGGAGVGKSLLIYTLKMFLEINFIDYVGSTEKLKVLLLATTGVPAIYINGTIIN